MAIPARNQRIIDTLKRGQQEKIAKILMVTRQNVNQILNSDKEVSDIKFIEAVSAITGCSVSWLTHGEKSEVNEQVVKQSPDVDKLEMLVASQRRTIELLEKEVKRLEEELRKVNK